LIDPMAKGAADSANACACFAPPKPRLAAAERAPQPGIA
jgi:hypothetical protein